MSVPVNECWRNWKKGELVNEGDSSCGHLIIDEQNEDDVMADYGRGDNAYEDDKFDERSQRSSSDESDVEILEGI